MSESDGSYGMTGGAGKSFTGHVFNFDDHTKSVVLNISQYSVLAIVPIVALNKLIQRFAPEADEDKGSFEILAEVIVQVLVMFVGLFFINRLVTYPSTFSGRPYADLHHPGLILSVLLISLSIQSKLGAKTTILFDRLVEACGWGADQGGRKGGKKGGHVVVTQPVSGGMSHSTPIDSLPHMDPRQVAHTAMADDPTGGVMAANDGGSGSSSLFGTLF